MDNSVNIDDLVHPAWNPRSISETDFNNLTEGIKLYGDLSGVVRNIVTGNLVGGNQRVEAFKYIGTDKIVITQRLEAPSSVGTTAYGYVIAPNGEQFTYREVQWNADITDENGKAASSKERAASIFANRVQGQWDLEKLGELDQWLLDNNPDLLAATGQSNDEIQQLLGNTPEPPAPLDDDMSPLKIKLTKSQYDTVDQAIQLMKSRQSVQNPINTDNDGNAIFLICQEYLATPAHAPTT